uniref:ESPR-type extended signal peptide-containing protein n=1 Tax=Luteimonas panaciterrae TaxID=363885 RepID=UPI0021F513BB
MNRIFRKVWNQSAGQVVVASELARPKGKGASVRSAKAVAVAVILGIAPPAFAGDACEQGDGIASLATGSGTLACGSGASAAAAGAVALGSGAKAIRIGATAVGNNALAEQTNTTAIGGSSRATGVAAVSIGSNSQALADRATTLGFQSQAHATSAIAVGANAYANESASGSVALGYGARTTEQNTVSIGSGGGAGAVGPATRRLVNVNAGVLAAGSTDAVNGDQLFATNERIDLAEARVESTRTRYYSVN